MEQLAKLNRRERHIVVEAAERAAEPRPLRGVSEEELRRLTGVVALGGDALEDCDALHDG